MIGLQWGGLLTNTAVHVVMYYYYFLTTQGISPWWKKYITSFQIVQFMSRCAALLPQPLQNRACSIRVMGCEWFFIWLTVALHLACPALQ